LLPNFAETYFNKGNALAILGQVDDALAAYARAIALKVEFADAHLNSGSLLQKAGRYEEAITILREMIRGGAETLRRAGVVLLGGHSVRDREIKFGFAVTGHMHPKRVITNRGARKGDLLVLTKPLGTGVLATALKRRLLDDATLRVITRQMTTLNRDAAEAMQAARASAATDVTGFGLLGHALNVARGSRVTIRVWSGAVPILSGVLDFAVRGVVPGGLTANAAYVEPETRYDDAVPAPVRAALADPQTSGGLLIAAAPPRVKDLMARLARARVKAAVIGEVLARGPRPLEVTA